MSPCPTHQPTSLLRATGAVPVVGRGGGRCSCSAGRPATRLARLSVGRSYGHAARGGGSRRPRQGRGGHGSQRSPAAVHAEPVRGLPAADTEGEGTGKWEVDGGKSTPSQSEPVWDTEGEY